MSNLDVAVSSFWQLARHWKQGEKAKLEPACEGGSLHMQLSAVLGHPDHPHFPHPPPPPPPPAPSPPILKKKKSPSQLRRQEQRQQEARTKADEAEPKRHNNDRTEKNLHNGVTIDKLAEVIVEAEAEIPSEPPFLLFNCEQCEYTNASEKGINQHKRMKHWISQLDGDGRHN